MIFRHVRLKLFYLILLIELPILLVKYFTWLCKKMFSEYLKYLMQKAQYKKGETGAIVATIDWYQWFYSQWDSIEDARENLLDAVEWVLAFKISIWDKYILKDMKIFFSKQTKFSKQFNKKELQYA